VIGLEDLRTNKTASGRIEDIAGLKGIDGMSS
jgi:hypothetical protein